jgi:nucleotide-binding universal stress UspA family protein
VSGLSAAISHRLKGSFEGALAGGGDPATSPLYVFGPFLQLLAVSGGGAACFGAPIWLVVVTVAVVSLMYRRVMQWVPDGSGGSGLCEEEFGSWAGKVSASITLIECTLTFLVSIAALVTFVADRVPALGGAWQRTLIAVGLSVATGVVVNRGPRLAARVFGPATAAVLLFLWLLIGAVIFRRGLHLPTFELAAFTGKLLPITLGGYVRLLALMTGIEVFANLVAAYDGPAHERARKAFGSLIIVMVTTLATMLIVGPAIFELSDPARTDVSVFTQAMDRLLPAPLPYIGTLVGIVVLLSAAAASAQAIQNLALGLRHRHYIPASIGQRNRFDVAGRPVIAQVGLVVACLLAFGTREETYLALYAAGVFVLLALTGWAAVKRQLRAVLAQRTARQGAELALGCVAASLTSGAAVLIFYERFTEGAWAYALLVPAIFAALTIVRARLGAPEPIAERLGRVLAQKRAIASATAPVWPQRILIMVDGSIESEVSVLSAVGIAARFHAPAYLCLVGDDPHLRGYGERLAKLLDEIPSLEPPCFIESVLDVDAAITQVGADLVVAAADRPAFRQLLGLVTVPLLLLRGHAPPEHRHTLLGRVLLGLDGSRAAEAALPLARVILRAGGELIVAVIPDGDDSNEQLTAYAERVTDELRPDGKVELVAAGSGPARMLEHLAAERDVDLVLVASHGRGGTDRAVKVGSVPARLAGELGRPLLVVHSGWQGAPAGQGQGQGQEQEQEQGADEA